MTLSHVVSGHMKPSKPPYGAPTCNGCGLCCLASLCDLGEEIFGHARGPCPALEDIGDRYACGLVRSPERYAPEQAEMHGAGALTLAAADMLGIGAGCNQRTEGEAGLPNAFTTRAISADKANAAIALWGIEGDLTDMRLRSIKRRLNEA